MRTTEDRSASIDAAWATLDDASQAAILDGAVAARQISRHHARAYWLRVGKALAEVRSEAFRLAHTNNDHHPLYRRNHGLLMSRVPDLEALRRQDKASAVAAVWVHENWDAVESWLAQKEIDAPGSNARMNHPQVLKRRYEAAMKTKPQGLEKAPTMTARKDLRIAELQEELDAKEREIRQLRRGADNVSEGRDWSWTDDPEAVAAVWLRLYPDRVAKIASKVLELMKPTASRKERKSTAAAPKPVRPKLKRPEAGELPLEPEPSDQP